MYKCNICGSVEEDQHDVVLHAGYLVRMLSTAIIFGALSIAKRDAAAAHVIRSSQRILQDIEAGLQ